ncbi:hypothetical protein PQX77_009066 [Marasmius sp. AFHP31]|nr:hypothetical protein PQX77_009066 [Marasmius sp. AFHP31]
MQLAPQGTKTKNERPRAYIAAMGGTGTGKTSFINLVGQSEFLVGDGLDSCTNRIQQHPFTFEGQDVVLIDIPGFDDSNKSDAEIVKMIADFLVSEYRADRCLSGVMYFHRITDVRMGGASRRNFTMFQKLCGEEAFSNVAIVTTRWDLEEEAVAMARFEEMKSKPQLCRPIVDKGGSMFPHDRTPDSANKIIRRLITGTSPMPLLIQREMAEGMKLSETTAGRQLEQEILEQVENHQRQVAEIIEEMEHIQDSTELEALEGDIRALRERAAHWQAEATKLSEAQLDPSADSEAPMRHSIDLDGPLLADSQVPIQQFGALNARAPGPTPSFVHAVPTRIPDTSTVLPPAVRPDTTTEPPQQFATIDDLGQVKKELLHMQHRQDRIEQEQSASVKYPTWLVGILDRVLVIFNNLRSRDVGQSWRPTTERSARTGR